VEKKKGDKKTIRGTPLEEKTGDKSMGAPRKEPGMRENHRKRTKRGKNSGLQSSGVKPDVGFSTEKKRHKRPEGGRKTVRSDPANKEGGGGSRGSCVKEKSELLIIKLHPGKKAKRSDREHLHQGRALRYKKKRY